MPATFTTHHGDHDLEAALDIVLGYMSQDALRRLDGDVERELAGGAGGSDAQPAYMAISQAVTRELERRAELATLECPGNARRTGAWLRAMATSRERGVRRRDS